MLAKNLVFNLIGHINHWVFCPNMPPGGDDKLDGELAAATEEPFWSFDGFPRHLTANALGVQGPGGQCSHGNRWGNC
jgi:Fe-Mn family superoxide dismutase